MYSFILHLLSEASCQFTVLRFIMRGEISVDNGDAVWFERLEKVSYCYRVSCGVKVV